MRPEFMKSPYFVPEVDNWHLKDGAPKEIVDEFEANMKADKEALEKGIILD